MNCNVEGVINEAIKKGNGEKKNVKDIKDNRKNENYVIRKEQSLTNLGSFNVTDTIEKFSDYMDWDNCEGLAFLKYLITHKKVLVDLNKSLDFKNMNVWIKE